MLLLTFLSCIVAIAAFLYGALKLFRKGVPLYFQILVCIAGCSALYELSNIITFFCDIYSDITYFTVGLFASFGAISFQVCANVGALNRVVKEGATRKSYLLALISPAVYIALHIGLIVMTMPSDPILGVMISLFMIPGIICCYLNMVHLLSKPDEMGFLLCIRGCDIWSLIGLFLAVISSLSYYVFDETSIVPYFSELIFTLGVFALVIAAERGAKAWKI